MDDQIGTDTKFITTDASSRKHDTPDLNQRSKTHIPVSPPDIHRKYPILLYDGGSHPGLPQQSYPENKWKW